MEKNPSRKGIPRGTLIVWGPRKTDIERMYFEQGWSQERIAEHYGVTQALMPRVFKRLGIKARPRWRCGEANGRYIDGSQARGYRNVVVKKTCAQCGGTKDLGIHHRNDDHFDNRPINLEVLCNSCHMRLTKKRWWDAKKAGLVPPKSNAPTGWTRTVPSKLGPIQKGSRRARLTRDQVASIRDERSSGKSLASLAEKYGVALSTVHAIVQRRSWK